ncbi:hypothetical protein M9Y10_010114 [Tritrichomonas musculus]|uniref:BTB domain-containing protein n=1 Tax=Tritrichomonas musculus TaxID=1915356 RepID=A0ABR2IQB3_9EUKA
MLGDFTLNFDEIKEIPFDKYENNFTFNVNGKIYKTNRVIADFLSPTIRNYHFNDQSFEEFTINTSVKDDSCDYFLDFLNLCKFDHIKLDSPHMTQYLEYFSQLGNTKEYLRLQPQYFEGLTIDNIVDRLKFIPQSLTSNDGFSKMISFAAKKFEKIPKEDLKELKLDIIEDIIKNPALKLYNEDGLLQFILELYEKDIKYSILFEYVQFNNVSKEVFKKFIEQFNIEYLNSKIWESICQCHPAQKKTATTSKRYKLRDLFEIIEINHSKENELNGIMHFLTEKTKGNIHDNQTIEITSNSVHGIHFQPRNLVDYANKNNFYASKDELLVSVCFDFKDKEIQLSSYSIKGLNENNCLNNWVLEVSNDKKKWIEIDRRENDTTLNGRNIVANFVNKQKKKFYKYVQIRQIGTNSTMNYSTNIMAIEFFGKLKMPK